MKVLIADDSGLCRHIIRSALEGWAYEVVEVCDGEQALQVLEAEDAPQVAILDWYMPKMDGIEICQRLREKRAPYCYVILLTATTDRAGLIQGLQAGADDFLSKPFDPPELEQRLRAGMRIIDLQDRLLKTQEELRIRATRDFLTNAWNRGAILEILDVELDRSARESSSTAIAMVDVDHFKQINDTYGHQVGDFVLEELVRRMKSTLRSYDSIGRYGGEEFLIVQPNTTLCESAQLAERLRQDIAAKPMHAAGYSLDVRISLGVSSLDGDDNARADSLIRVADIALYEAKESGRNCVHAVPVKCMQDFLDPHQELVCP